MQRWTSGIFKRVTNSITDDTGFVCFTALAQDDRFRIEVIGYSSSRIDTQVARFDILFRVIPGSPTVIEEEGEYNTTHGANHKHTCRRLGTKNGANSDGS